MKRRTLYRNLRVKASTYRALAQASHMLEVTPSDALDVMLAAAAAGVPHGDDPFAAAAAGVRAGNAALAKARIANRRKP